MMYVGYPVSYETVCELFKMNPSSWVFNEDSIKMTGLEFHMIDKNLCVLGLVVNEIWENYTSVDDSLILIIQYKARVMDYIKKAGIDLSNLKIEQLGEESSVFVKNPQPYLLNL